MKFIALLALALTIVTCSKKDEPTPAPVARHDNVAQQVVVPPAFLYFTERGGQMAPERITLERWNHFAPGGRLSYLRQFYFATTRSRSNRGLRHDVCFEGTGSEVAQKFLSGPNVAPIRDVRGVHTSVSEDDHMIGIDFTLTERDRAGNSRDRDLHFRVSACATIGKNAPPDATSTQAGSARNLIQRTFLTNPNGEATESEVTTAADLNDTETDTVDDGFGISDTVRDRGRFPTFELKGDYENAAEDAVPWANMDISNPQGARQFTDAVQAYFYDGLANQNATDADQNFIAQNVRNRYWCHMPWLHVGANGREAVHGLTNERELKPSAIYNFNPQRVKGSDWGIAFYNGIACKSLSKVFGNTGHRKPTPDWSQKLPDGSMAVKILFTTAVDDTNLPQLTGAYEWNAHVSLPNSTSRVVRRVRHIQMDIAVKDCRLKGIKEDKEKAACWMMTTYYFDKTFRAAPVVANIRNLPEGLKHMRPVGVQTGFEARDSMIFQGAQTNQRDRLLNGPADNDRSSCLSCHGTAGTRLAMAPGIMKNPDWLRVRDTALDLSQQLALARRNFQTQSSKNRD